MAKLDTLTAQDGSLLFRSSSMLGRSQRDWLRFRLEGSGALSISGVHLSFLPSTVKQGVSPKGSPPWSLRMADGDTLTTQVRRSFQHSSRWRGTFRAKWQSCTARMAASSSTNVGHPLLPRISTSAPEAL